MRIPAPSPDIVKVVEFMRKRGLEANDLIDVGWEPRFASNPKSPAAEKCRRVGRCWELMAKLGVKYSDLEGAAS